MPTLSKSDVDLILRMELGTTDYELLACEEQELEDVSRGFLSSSSKSKVVYRHENIIKELHLFVKGLPELGGHCEVVRELGTCRREVMAFQVFLNKQVSSSEEGQYFPRCYLARGEDVVLEDLSKKGYLNLPLLQDYDLEHCKKVVESVARLHVASLDFEEERGPLTGHIPGLEQDVIFSTTEGHVGRTRHLVGVEALKKLAGEYCTEYAEDVVERAFRFMKEFPALLVPSKTYRNVFSHLDLWNNNIMFRYRDGAVKNACLIDFQCASYRPPAMDLLLFLHCCTSAGFRQRHWPELLETYRASSGGRLELSAGELAEVLPLVLVTAVQYLHFVYIPDSLMAPVLLDRQLWTKFYLEDRSELVLKAASLDLGYRQRVVGALSQLFDYFSATS